jgi:hypothetical protein
MNGIGANVSFDLHQDGKHGPALGGSEKDGVMSGPRIVAMVVAHRIRGLHGRAQT